MSGVLLIVGRLRPRGSSGIALNFARGLAVRGHSVNLICRHHVRIAPDIGQAVRVHRWSDIANPNALYFTARRLRRIAREWGVDVIHVCGPDIGRRAVRLVRTAGIPYVLAAFPSGRRDRTIVQLRSHADRVLAMSQSAREELVNEFGVAKRKIALIPPGLDTCEYPASYPFASERAPVIGMAATLSRDGAQGTFVSAAGKLRDHAAGPQFLIVGDGPGESIMRRQVKELRLHEHVCFADRVEDYRPLLACMDIVVCPHPTGDNGYTAMEAMAMGKAVVAADVGGIYDLISDGVTGRLVAGNDPQALADAACELLADPERARQLGRSAREHIGARFGLDDAVARIQEVYDAVGKERTAAL